MKTFIFRSLNAFLDLESGAILACIVVNRAATTKSIKSLTIDNQKCSVECLSV